MDWLETIFKGLLSEYLVLLKMVDLVSTSVEKNIVKSVFSVKDSEMGNTFELNLVINLSLGTVYLSNGWSRVGKIKQLEFKVIT